VTTILIIITCIFSFIIIYVYLGYPLLLYIYSLWHSQSVRKGDIDPKVSMIIAAYNEEKVIKEKIENSLNLDYPKENLQIIVASDSSTDRTNQIVADYEKKGVILYVQKERKGKTMALNNAISQANGEILIFTDATAMLEKDCIRQIVRNFNDPSVGCVCPKVIYRNVTDNNITQIEGLYRRYEFCLKKRESWIGSLAFVAGACYAIQKKLHKPVEPEYDYDCISPLDVISEKYRVVYDPEAKFYETVVTSSRDLFKSKIRMITKDFAGTLSRKNLLNPFKYRWISLTLFSHKLLRWLIPFFLIIVFICNLFLIDIQLFQFLLVGQIIYYLGALFGLILKEKKGLFSIPFYFCIINLAALIGVYRAILGEKIPVWQPIR